MKKIAIFTLLLVIPKLCNSQNYWTFGERFKAYEDTIQIGLMVKMVPNTSLKQIEFVSTVGGVAFLTLAKPDKSIENVKLNYFYQPSNNDGERFFITINEKDTIVCDLPDWQFIPIAKYADSDFNSCVSLFGPRTTKSQWDVLFHPAFTNTLLGMRILHADMALMDLESFSGLPKYGGVEMLGLHEIKAEENEWIEAAIEIQKIMMSEKYQSWVLTDDGVNCVFSIKEDKLCFSSNPYYYFWKTDEGSFRSTRDSLYMVYSLHIEKHNMYVEKYNAGNTNYEKSINALKLKIKEFEARINEMKQEVIPLASLTNKLREKYDLLIAYNPPVYHAIEHTMHYSAFFRYLKKQNPGKWNRFLKKLDERSVLPEVTTPTIIPKSE